MNKKTITIIPYFGGISNYSPDHTQQALDTREEWFRYCLHSVKKISDFVMVGCCNEKDFSTLQPFTLDNQIKVLYFRELDKPEFLPYVLALNIQEGFKEGSNSFFEFVYYTEMDQIFYAKNLDGMKDIIKKDKNVYFSPQRFEQIPAENVGKRKNRFSVAEDRFVDFNGIFRENNNPYVVCNEPMEIEDYDDNFYTNKKRKIIYEDLTSGHYGGAYGAAWFTSAELFLDVKFESIEFQPTEQIGGHCLLRHPKSKCLKSKDYFHFHVDHLSGYEFNKNL